MDLPTANRTACRVDAGHGPARARRRADDRRRSVAFYYFADQVNVRCARSCAGGLGAGAALAYQTAPGRLMWSYVRGTNVEPAQDDVAHAPGRPAGHR